MSGVVRIEIRETTEELKTLMRQEKDVLRHEKLQVLYWLKTQTVDSVLSAAVRLGKHRTTIQRWLSSYRSGGIGFSSYKEVHQWLTNCCDVPVAYRTVHQWTRYRLQGKLKVPRPVSEKQKAGAVEEFKKNSQFSSKQV
jgi:hypothetical protein